MTKKVFIACDHAGLSLKKTLLKHFPDVAWEDLGTHGEESVDYPDFADHVAKRVNAGEGIGVLICGSGQGMAMRANKYSKVRAALCWSEETAKLSREHNDANILCLGSRLLPSNLSESILKVFLATPFSGGRHKTRVDKVEKPC